MRVLTTTVLCTGLLMTIVGAASASVPSPTDVIEGEEPTSVIVEKPLADTTDVIVDAEPIETYYEPNTLGKRIAYKCRSAKVAYVKKTLLGAVAFKWWMKRSWCWKPSSRLVSVGTSTWVSDMDGFTVYNGIVQAWGAWFQWCCDEPRSGHRAFRQAEFQNCIFKYGCLSTTYPWIKMAVRGDGSFSYSMGD